LLVKGFFSCSWGPDRARSRQGGLLILFWGGSEAGSSRASKTSYFTNFFTVNRWM
jgi:hypothetical protein